MENILDLDLEELKERFRDDKMPSARAKQLYSWIYRKFVFDFNEMSDLSKELRKALPERFTVMPLEKLDTAGSPEEEAVKFLFRCADGECIETVLLIAGDDEPEPDDEEVRGRLTLCVSSQAGCALGCRFCATGKLGFRRDLTAGEIVAQALWVEKYLSGPRERTGRARSAEKTERRISNIVFMGMGEPLLNYRNVMKAVRILNRDEGYRLGARHITISTAGVVPGILELAKEKEQIRLAVSLHMADQKKREEWMPLARKYGLRELSDALKTYQGATGRRITFEYIPIEGVNMSGEDVRLLREWLTGLDYNLNVIAYNEVEGSDVRAPSEDALKAFAGMLKQNRMPYVFRRSKGRGRKAACGQLGLYWKGLNG